MAKITLILFLSMLFLFILIGLIISAIDLTIDRRSERDNDDLHYFLLKNESINLKFKTKKTMKNFIKFIIKCFAFLAIIGLALLFCFLVLLPVMIGTIKIISGFSIIMGLGILLQYIIDYVLRLIDFWFLNKDNFTYDKHEIF